MFINAFQYSLQRYDKDFFLRILQAEILAELHRAQRLGIRDLDNTDGSHGSRPNSRAAENSGEENHNNNSNIAVGSGGDRNMNMAASAKHLLMEQREQMLESSMSLYLDRKKEQQRGWVQDAYKEVGKRIEVYNPEVDKWNKTVIKQCNVKWIDNGMTAKITHTMVELTKGGEVVREYEADLRTLRYFELADQVSGQSGNDA